MRIYVASSWRNEKQQHVVRALREAGHDVYDFRNPAPGNQGFGWRQCATADQLTDPKRFRDEVLAHPIAVAGFMHDMDALASAEATVLVLPCGRSAHLELGYATGQKQFTVVLLDDPISEPELMYLACSSITTSIEETIEVLRALQVLTPTKEDVLTKTPRVHELKSWPEFFQPVVDGRKTFEYRKNDRDFQEGDYLHLREWDPQKKDYTGREHTVRVSYVTPATSTSVGISDGYAVLGIQRTYRCAALEKTP